MARILPNVSKTKNWYLEVKLFRNTEALLPTYNYGNDKEKVYYNLKINILPGKLRLKPVASVTKNKYLILCKNFYFTAIASYIFIDVLLNNFGFILGRKKWK